MMHHAHTGRFLWLFNEEGVRDQEPPFWSLISGSPWLLLAMLLVGVAMARVLAPRLKPRHVRLAQAVAFGGWALVSLAALLLAAVVLTAWV